MAIWKKVEGVGGSSGTVIREGTHSLENSGFNIKNDNLYINQVNQIKFSTSTYQSEKRLSNIFCLPFACILHYDDGSFKFAGYPYYQRTSKTTSSYNYQIWYSSSNSSINDISNFSNNKLSSHSVNRYIGILNDSFVDDPTANTPKFINSTNPTTDYHYTFKDGLALGQISLESNNQKHVFLRFKKFKDIYFNISKVNNQPTSLLGVIDFGKHKDLYNLNSILYLDSLYSSPYYRDFGIQNSDFISYYINPERNNQISGSGNSVYAGGGFFFKSSNDFNVFKYTTVDGNNIQALTAITKSNQEGNNNRFLLQENSNYIGLFNVFLSSTAAHNNFYHYSQLDHSTYINKNYFAPSFQNFSFVTKDNISSAIWGAIKTFNCPGHTNGTSTVALSNTAIRSQKIFLNNYSKNVWFFGKRIVADSNILAVHNKIFDNNYTASGNNNVVSNGANDGGVIQPLNLTNITNILPFFEPVHISGGLSSSIMIFKRELEDNNYLIAGTGLNSECGLGAIGSTYLFTPIGNNFTNITFDLTTTSGVLTINKVIKISSGKNHHLLLVKLYGGNNVVLSIGKNNKGQLGNGTILDSTGSFSLLTFTSEPIEIECGEEYSVVVCKNGDIFTFGDNSFGQLGINDTINNYITLPTLIQIE